MRSLQELMEDLDMKWDGLLDTSSSLIQMSRIGGRYFLKMENVGDWDDSHWA